MGLGIMEALCLVQQEGSQARGAGPRGSRRHGGGGARSAGDVLDEALFEEPVRSWMKPSSRMWGRGRRCLKSYKDYVSQFDYQGLFLLTLLIFCLENN